MEGAMDGSGNYAAERLMQAQVSASASVRMPDGEVLGVHEVEGRLHHEARKAREARGHMLFGDALEVLRAGGVVKRSSWPEGQRLALVSSWNGRMNVSLGPDWRAPPFIGLADLSGSKSPWVAGHGDLLADDWVVVAQEVA